MIWPIDTYIVQVIHTFYIHGHGRDKKHRNWKYSSHAFVNQIEREDKVEHKTKTFFIPCFFYIHIIMQWLAFEMRFLLENCWIVTMKNLHFCTQKFIPISNWKSFDVVNATFDNWELYCLTYFIFSMKGRKIRAKSPVSLISSGRLKSLFPYFFTQFTLELWSALDEKKMQFIFPLFSD